MRRLIAGLIVVAVAPLGLSAEERPRFVVEFELLQKELADKLDAAKTNAERKELNQKYAQRYLAYAEKYSKEPLAFYALVECVELSQTKAGPGAKALALLEKNHVGDKRMRRVVAQLADRGDEAGARVVKAVIEKGADRKVQAKACKAMAESREGFVALTEEIKTEARKRGALTKKRGREFVKNLLASEEQNKKDAKFYRKLYQDKFAGVLPDLSIGKVAPEVIGRDLDGKQVKLSSYRGKVVVLDIWATWCGPCRAMIPHERELVKRLKGKPFVLLSISADDTKETLVNFLKREPMPWAHWWNGPEGGIIEDWEVEGFPTIYVLDHKGVIRYKDVRNERMTDAVKELLDELEAAKKK
jgi:thiol-disulfide isomerase/thioredoxin